MRMFFMLIFGSISLWDAYTTFAGTQSALHRSDAAFIISLVAAIAVAAFGWGTRYIFTDSSDLPKGSMLIFAPLWLVSIIFNIYTSFIGNAQLIVLQESEIIRLDVKILTQSLTSSEFWIAVGITILVSGSTLMFSFFISDK